MKRFLKKVAISAGLDRLFMRRSNAAIVLGFHNVEAHDGSMLSKRVAPISPDVFEGILSHLQHLGYSFVPLSNIVNSSDHSGKAAITFDDGFRSVYTNAFPILTKFRAPFTVFLTTSTLGTNSLLWLHRIHTAVDRLAPEDTCRIMSHHALKVQSGVSLKVMLGALVRQESPELLLRLVDELAAEAKITKSNEQSLAERLYLRYEEIDDMLKDGMTIGAHGHNHWCLSNLNQSQTKAEISMCKEKIEAAFGVQAVHYALPYGSPNRHVMPILKRLGFNSLCTSMRGLVQESTNRYALPRLMVGTDTGADDLVGQVILLHLQRFVTGNRVNSLVQ